MKFVFEKRSHVEKSLYAISVVFTLFNVK
jgi:hypothetical protein